MKYRLLFILLSVISLFEVIILVPDIQSNWLLLAYTLMWLISIQLREYILYHKWTHFLFVLVELILLTFIQIQSQAVFFSMIALEALTILLSPFLTTSYLFEIILMISSSFMVFKYNPAGFVPFLLLIGLILLIYDYLINEKQRLVQIETLSQQNEALTLKLDDLEKQMTTSKELYTLMERNRISRELHDSIGHSLSTIIIQLGAITKLTEKTQPQVSEMAHTLRQFTQDGLQEVRKVLHDLKPQQLEKLTIINRLKEFVSEAEKTSPFTIHFRHNQPLWTLDEQQSLAIFRIVQEFFSNTKKYAQANQLWITLMFQESELILTLKDDGIGFDTVQPKMGMSNIQERSKEINATTVIESEKEKGVRLRMVLPKGVNNE